MILTEIKSIIIIVHQISVGKSREDSLRTCLSFRGHSTWLVAFTNAMSSSCETLQHQKPFLHFQPILPWAMLQLGTWTPSIQPSYTLSLIKFTPCLSSNAQKPTSSQHHHRTQTTPRIPQSPKNSMPWCYPFNFLQLQWHGTKCTRTTSDPISKKIKTYSFFLLRVVDDSEHAMLTKFRFAITLPNPRLPSTMIAHEPPRKPNREPPRDTIPNDNLPYTCC